MSIIIKNLNKIYPNGNHALKDVNLEIPAGMFGLLGPNGAGKSTTIKSIVGILSSYSCSPYGTNFRAGRNLRL